MPNETGDKLLRQIRMSNKFILKYPRATEFLQSGIRYSELMLSSLEACLAEYGKIPETSEEVLLLVNKNNEQARSTAGKIDQIQARWQNAAADICLNLMNGIMGGIMQDLANNVTEYVNQVSVIPEQQGINKIEESKGKSSQQQKFKDAIKEMESKIKEQEAKTQKPGVKTQEKVTQMSEEQEIEAQASEEHDEGKVPDFSNFDAFNDPLFQ